MIHKAFSNLALPILISYYPSTCPLDCSLTGPAPCSSTCLGWSHLRAFAHAVSSAFNILAHPLSTWPTPSPSRPQQRHQFPGTTSLSQTPPSPGSGPLLQTPICTCTSPCNSNHTVVLQYLLVSPTGFRALCEWGPHWFYSPWFPQFLAQDLTQIFVEQINK